MTNPENKQRIFYIGFPSMAMMTHRKPVPFEVLEENDETLTVKILEDVPCLGEGLEAEIDVPKAGQEFRISRSHRGRRDILNELRSGNVVAYYADKLDYPNKEFYFTGTLFPYNPNKKEEQ